MPRRSITDKEIALIRAMLARGMRNRDIQFYFNRQDRPVNAGRISEIRGGTYGPRIPVADQAEVETFLSAFAPAEVGVVADRGAPAKSQSLTEQAREHFERRDDGHWYLVDGETSEQECKERFDPERMHSIIKTIAALANNQGGYVFIGIEDSEYRVVGLPDNGFQDIDIATITDKVKTFLSPTPSFSIDVLGLGETQVGIIRVEKYSIPPIIVSRDGDGLRDGAILFRYSGQSAPIKCGDLHSMLRERDQSSNTLLLSSAARLSQIGTDKALIVDTQEGSLSAGETRITIDRELANQLEFIREGEFEEREGAPTLRLVGDVMTVDAAGQVRERIEGRAITPDMAVNAYLRRERVSSPMAYMCLSAHVQRHWLPLYYFVDLSGQSIVAAIQALESTEEAVYRNSKQRALERLRGERSAYTVMSGNAEPVGAEIQAGQLQGIRERHRPVLIARAIQGLPDEFSNIQPLLELLDVLHEEFHDDGTIRGAIYRAASRLEEMEFMVTQ